MSHNSINGGPYIRLAGTGSYLPGKPIPPEDVDLYLGAMTEAPPKVRRWLERIRPLMKEMLDIDFYHFAIDPETRQFTEDNVTMSVKAARQAISDAEFTPEDIELIVYGSAHQDQMPTASVRIQEMLGIEQCGEISVHANCTSAYKALLLGHDLLCNGRYRNALIISSSISSSELVAEYYNQPLVTKEELFLRYFLSDGAAALVLKAEDQRSNGLFVDHVYMESIGGKKTSAMGNKRPAYWMNPKEEFEKGYHHLAQMFQEELRANFHEADGSVFLKGLKRMIAKYDIDLSTLRFFQVNFPSKHITELVMEECESLGIPRNTLYPKMATMGYIGPPMAFLCLDKIRKEEELKNGDTILSFVTEVSKFMQAGYLITNYGLRMTTDKKYRLFLISPHQKYINYPAHVELAKMFGKKRLMIPLALPTVARLTPDHYNISIYDEDIEPMPSGIVPDIVGITTLAATISRAYELGDHYRSKGSKVVFGGPYASFMIQEASNHADSIVVGEAEGLWEECLRDFEQGSMQPVYRTDVFGPYKKQQPPRWDLIPHHKIFQVAVQASRGCPFNCDFCLVSKMFGRKMRYREIENVVEEIKAAPSKYIFFVDDNLTINKKYAKELMKAIKPLGISWGCMSSIDVATDDELLYLMAEAGCFNILIGFESLNPASLDETHKLHNKATTIYEPAIQKIHSYGIHINASFVVGFDNDTLQEFDNIFDFSMRTNMPSVNLHLLAAPPGSEIHKKYKEEGRLAECKPEFGSGHFPTLHYMNMSQIELFDKYMETIQRLYSFDTAYKKAINLFSGGAFIRKGGDIPAMLKARLSWIIFKEFILTTDPDRRKLFGFIFNLIRRKKIAIDKGFSYLLSMLSSHRQIEQHQKNMQEYRELVLSYTSPAWKEKLRKKEKTNNS
jgi:3-oxoacyl-[acyl-carrier-protein] synthase III